LIFFEYSLTRINSHEYDERNYKANTII